MQQQTYRNIWYRAILFACFAATFFLISSEAMMRCSQLLEQYIILGKEDAGTQWLFNTWLRTLLWLNPNHRVFGEDLFAFQTAVLFLFAVLMLAPNVPLAVAIGGQLTLLLLWWVFGEISEDRHAIEAWNVTL